MEYFKEELLMNEIVLNLPEGLENMNLPDPELVTYYRELEERIFGLRVKLLPMTQCLWRSKF